MDHKKQNIIVSVWNLYADGFRNMTWGRPLWGLIILKIVILFAILRVFFFQPVLSGKTDSEKSEFVGERLTEYLDDNV
ncbi:MAG: DUF4492 domain-containing protein [Bacteroidetes bacterium]|uniref:DUF4492 domain-containing protein n=1 Tax=Candidatus Cryptobacteroides faecipullorum TaxID=2840764 RepID=A0A9D9I7F8_9BACT|nr:DUF4492 domain-containing protein [Candidatus Cryptobacteroides faecipullorum]